MTDKQPEALRRADHLDAVDTHVLQSNTLKPAAALLRTQHAAIARKDALLRQALEAMQQCFDHDRFSPSVKAMHDIKQELSQ